MASEMVSGEVMKNIQEHCTKSAKIIQRQLQQVWHLSDSNIRQQPRPPLQQPSESITLPTMPVVYYSPAFPPPDL